MLKMYNAHDELMTMPLTMSWTSLNRGRRVPITEIISGGGVLSGPEVPEVRRFTASGSIYYKTYAEMRSFFDEILAFIEDTPLRVYQEDTDSRFIFARCINVTDNWLDGRAELELTMDFVAIDPYFYSIEHTDVQSFASSPLQYTLHVGGNVNTYPMFVINRMSGSIEGLRIENLTTGGYIKFSDTVASGLTIDNKNLMVLSGDTSVLSTVNTDWLINSLFLQPGENRLKITGIGTFVFSVVVKWRSKWL